ncbi:respiratory nitrate reductase 1 subunit alpha [Salmonella enterica subsp. enterica]|uniref:Respiratory nitrate reductase 1 subunit alpha n=1 Tax=Salmonella enterica I TaxID=59201 RepID=A0A3S4HZP6_SALET|nr:respiratory nitrate reductase 1 subunit alpha [Salmonella enterica subsp. enterica]
MSKFLDRFSLLQAERAKPFADGHGQLLETNRDWEDGYRQRWQHDKIVRSTHGVNCTGSCSWKIYVQKWSGDLGKHSKPITRAPVLTCQTMNLAAARAGQATPGISTALTD